MPPKPMPAGSKDRMPPVRAIMRPPSAPPISNKRKERDFDDEVSNETNINVVVRCRGRNDREVRENSGVVLSTTGVKGTNVELSMAYNALSNKTYHFDKVYSPAADQATIFEDTVSPILSDMLSGYNCTIFAYGQTGTGKTYTMSGDMSDNLGLLSDAAGIIPRVLYSLFQKLENDEVDCSVKCSFIELYNEELRDLLTAEEKQKLKLYDDTTKKSQTATVVHGMEESHINSAAAGIKLLQQGSHRRQVAATKCNDLSSRSHTVFTITTYTKKSDASEEMVCSGKLNLVDLAGSENIQRSGAENKRAAEAGLINKSLLTLGRVINALVDKSSHIPYRESKLTRLLQDSLGGRTKTCIIATVSPAKSNLEETISTLDYAFRAKNIRNKPQVNSAISKKTLLKEFTTEIERLKSELIATRQRNGVYLSNEKFEEISVESESRRILSEEQKARIEMLEANLRNKVQELFNLTNNFSTLKKDNDASRISLENTKDLLEKTELVLENTRRNLDEERTTRMAHAATEIKLRGIGHQLISTIGDSVRDLDSTHAKLRRRSALHHQNQDIWRRDKAQVRDVTTVLDARIDQIQQQWSESLNILSDRIFAFVTDSVSRLAQVQQHVEAESSHIAIEAKRMKGELHEGELSMTTVLEEITVVREDVRTKVGQGLEGLSEAAAKISESIIAELDQFRTQLHSAYSGLGKELKQTLEDISKELVEQRSESEHLRQALQAANKKSLEASLKASVQLQTFRDAERRAAEDERAQCLQQISEILAASYSRQEDRYTENIITIKSGIIQAAEDFELAGQEYAQGLAEVNHKDDLLVEKVNKSKEAIKSKMKKDWTAIDARNTAIQMSTKAVHEETVKIVETQRETMATQMSALDTFVTRARQQNRDAYEAISEKVGLLSSSVQSKLGETQAALDCTYVQTMNTDVQDHIRRAADLTIPLDLLVRQPLQSLSAYIDASMFTEYQPTGSTPAKREWRYPTELPTTHGEKPFIAENVRKHLPAPSTSRSPRKTPHTSPKKLISPRKIVKEIYVDSPEETSTLNVLAALPVTASSSLKEICINTTGQAAVASSTEQIEGAMGDTAMVDNMPDLRQTRSRSAKSLSAGVSRKEMADAGKENFNPSKSISALPSGRRLRSSPIMTD